jgi:cyclic pyranopterin phosphate synthase
MPSALPVIQPLGDRFQRRITYLRVSLTDRCNYRCVYCMPEQGVDAVARAELLTFEEIVRLVGVFAGLGVRRVRLTGGEPTIRRGVAELVAGVAAVPGIDAVVMTTNGHLLAELAGPLAAAGMREINVSIDTLDPARFAHITRRGELARVVAGIDCALERGMRVKLNAVALRGFNDDELAALCRFAWARGAVPRFIEHMPMSDGALYAPGRQLAAAEVRAALERELGAPLEPAPPPAGAPPTGPARYWRVAGDPAREVGVISAMTEHFCDTCNRVRLTAVGQLHTCLAYDDAADLRGLLRGGDGDASIAAAIRDAVLGKRAGHEFERSGTGAPAKHMVSIGG